MITVGPYPCNIPQKGVNENTITCETTYAFDKERRIDLDVSLQVTGKLPSNCQGKCKFTYSESNTPKLMNLVPNIATPRSIVSWYAKWKVWNEKDIRNISFENEKLGRFNCNQFDLNDNSLPLNLNNDRQIHANEYTYVNCEVAEDQPAGYYQIYSQSTYGNLMVHCGSNYYYFDGEEKIEYQFILVPQIISIDQNIGGSLGNILKIEGRGFGKDIENIQVTVDNLNCNVIEANNFELTCELEAGETPQITDPEEYKLGGSGLEYTVYNLNGSGIGSAGKLKEDLDTIGAERIIKQGVTSSIQYVIPYKSGIHLKGFFKAPYDGEYNFWSSADDSIGIYMNKQTPGKYIESEIEQIQYRGSWNSNGSYYYPYQDEFRSKGIEFLGGQSYWIEIFAYNGGGSGHMKVSVETPPNPQAKEVQYNSVDFIQDFEIVPDADFVIYEFTVNNHQEPFGLEFVYFDIGKRETQVDQTDSKIWSEWNASNFGSQVNRASNYQGVEATEILLDTSGNECPDQNDAGGCGATGKKWTFTWTKRRDEEGRRAAPLTVIGNSIPADKFTLEKTMEQTPPVTGTYSLSYRGEPVEVWDSDLADWSTDIPFDCSLYNIREGLVKITDNFDIEISSLGKSVNGGINYRIWYKNQTEKNLKEGISFTALNLEGGRTGTTPTIEIKDFLLPSNRPLYEPLNYDMTYTAVKEGSVTVKVNGILSQCDGLCEYATDTSLDAVLQSYTVSSNDLTLDLSGNASITALTSEDTSIMFANSECKSADFTNLSAVTCSVTDGQVAGDHKPIIMVKNIGYLGYDAAVTDTVVNLVVSSVSPNTGSIQGGIQVTITGTGFPHKISQDLSVQFGTAISKIVSTSNTQIVVDLPPTEDSFSSPIKVKVIYGAKESDTSSTDQNFQYSDAGLPTLTAISPEDASPVLKNSITLTGTNFGTDKSLIKVYLMHKDTEKIAYDLNVNTCADTEIQATLGGGHVGEYDVRIIKDGVGYSIGDIQFQYIIKIESVSPSSGSFFGGTLMTITGQNFSDNLFDNAIFLEYDFATNLQCNIQTATSTEITCLTPPYSPSFTDGKALKVIVMGRLIEEATCTNNDPTQCQFTYTNIAGSPSLDLLQPNQSFKNGESINVTGLGFQSGSGITMEINGSKAAGTVNSDTEASFTIPNDVIAGEHLILITVDSIGYAGAFLGEIQFALDTTVPDQNTGVSRAGEDIIINGSGFDQDTIKIYVENENNPCLIESVTPKQIQCRLPRQAAGAKTLKIEQAGQDEAIACQNCINYSDSSTPKITSISPSHEGTITAASTITFNISQQTLLSNSDTTAYLELIADKSVRYTSATVSSSQITFSDVPVGEYELFIHTTNYGYAIKTNSDGNVPKFTVNMDVSSITPISTSLMGGSTLSISGNGFDSENLKNNKVFVCGFGCEIKSDSTFSQLNCILPQIPSVYLREEKKVNKAPKILIKGGQDISHEIKKYTLISDQNDPEMSKVIVDNQERTFYNSPNAECYIGFDFGTTQKVVLDSILYKGKVSTDIWAYTSIKGSILQSSNDGSTWTDIMTIGADLHQGFNQYRLDYDKDSAFRYLRFYNSGDEEGQNCQFSEITIKGYQYNDQSLGTTRQDQVCDVEVLVNGLEPTTNAVQSNIVTYSEADTPHVTDIVPGYGWILGGDSVVISGDGFGTNQADITVLIDGIECSVTALTDTQITCDTGSKGISNFDPPSLAVFKGDFKAIVPDGLLFYYGLLWSEDATWGGEAPPRSQDSVYVPEGQILIVDKSSPVFLNAVICEGIMIFADNQDMTFDAEYILIRKGKFIIGSENKPYQNNLVITLYGNYFGKQLPEIGNKVLACLQCELDIHGTPKEPTWTFLKTTINPDDTTLELTVQTNWEIGDKLAIATTDFDGKHSEEVEITAITHSSSGDSITFTPALKYKHVSAIETYGSHELKMQAEIGVLNRNVVVQGNPEDSIIDDYGGHLIVHGRTEAGSVAKISQAEFRYTGQPRIIGRYNIHFHMNGEASQSYIKGVASHHTNARFVAIHAVSYLRVLDSVAYLCKGHNIFLEDGIETHNTISGNLILSPVSANNMHQTDLTVACIWVTNPLNYITYNHVVGSQFYGMWWEIKHHPDGPSATADICPEGMPIGQLEHNVGHSNVRFGLRFFHLWPREKPCQDLSNYENENPFDDNPSIQSLISNFTAYKNGESGVLAEHVGNMVFQDIIMADNWRAGFEAHEAGYTKEEVVLKDSVIIGRSQNNAETVEFHQDAGTCALSYPRSNGCRVKATEFYNFGAGTHILESASQNQFSELQTVGGKTHIVEDVTLTNCDDSDMVKFIGPKNTIFFDVDGTFTGKNVPTYITQYEVHFDKAIDDGSCTYDDTNANRYDNSVLCSTPIRSLFIEMPDQRRFENNIMKVFNLANTDRYFGPDPYDDTVDEPIITYEQEQDNNFTETMAGGMLSPDCFSCFTTQLPVGYVYNIHWELGKDFYDIIIRGAEYYDINDPNTILRFNYTEVRELFEVHHRLGDWNQNLIDQQEDLNKFIDPVTNYAATGNDRCSNGDTFVDTENRLFYLCLSGKEKLNNYEKTAIKAIYCRETCPIPGFACEKEVGVIRQFSEQSQYLEASEGLALRKLPGEVEYSYGVPQAGDDVLIPCEWTMVFDVESFEFGTLIIDGTLKFDITKNYQKIKATNIWVRGGRFIAGTPDDPFPGKIDIELDGTRLGEPLIIDNFSATGTKSIGVTGYMELYGMDTTGSTQFTRLAANAEVGDNSIQVIDDISAWQVGDEIVLGAAKANGDGFERKTISSIDTSTKTIGITESIEYFHYGSDKKTVGHNSDDYNLEIDASLGEDLDMRCAVGHITRNIKIYGTTTDNWGGHLQVYHWVNSQEGIEAKGKLILHNVQFENMGQEQTENAGLHLYYTNLQGGEKTVINKCSFSNCVGKCVKADNAFYFDFTNNIVYNGELALVEIVKPQAITVTNNLMIAAVESQNGPSNFVAIFYLYEVISVDDILSHQLTVQNNIGQGSAGLGLGITAFPCTVNENNIPFKNNQVGFCKLAGVIFNNKYGDCFYEGHVSVFQSGDGVSVNTSVASYTLNKIIVAECKKSVKLRSGSGGAIIHENFFKNSWVAAVAREDCSDCYNSDNVWHTNCNSAFATQLHVTVDHGNTLISTGFGGLDAICNAPPPYTSMFLNNVKYYNYKASYSGGNQCSENIIFKNHPVASDATAGHYLTEVECIDCERTQFANLLDPLPEWRGWFGGCGDMDCTGQENILVHDFTGSLLGYEGAIISNNESIGDSMDECTFVPDWNAFDCQTAMLGVLEWDAIGPDRLQMMSSPVTLTNSQFSNVVNQYREWGWNGPEPLNQRPNTFVALILANQVHHVDYAGTKPFDLMHKMQQRVIGGEQDRFIILQYAYSNPMTIQVLVKGEVIDSFDISLEIDLMDHATTCGANNYFPETREIHFVITNDPECQVQVRLINSVQVNVRLSMSKEDFFSDDAAQTNFIDRISAFLSIPTDRLKIVGIKEVPARIRRRNLSNTELEIAFDIQGEAPGGDNYNPQAVFTQLQSLGQSIKEGLDNDILDLGVPVAGVSYSVIVAEDAGIEDESQFFTEEDLVLDEDGEDGNNNNDDDDDLDNIDVTGDSPKQPTEKTSGSSMIMIIIGVIVAVIVALIVGIVYLIHKRNKNKVKISKVTRASIKRLSMKENQLYIQSNIPNENYLDEDQKTEISDKLYTTKSKNKRIANFKIQYGKMETQSSIYTPSPGKLEHMNSTMSSAGKRKNRFDFKLNTEITQNTQYTDNDLVLKEFENTDRDSINQQPSQKNMLSTQKISIIKPILEEETSLEKNVKKNEKVEDEAGDKIEEFPLEQQ